MKIVRPFVIALAVASLILGAIGILSPALSMALWLAAAIGLACHPSSPVLRMMSAALIGGQGEEPGSVRR